MNVSGACSCARYGGMGSCLQGIFQMTRPHRTTSSASRAGGMNLERTLRPFATSRTKFTAWVYIGGSLLAAILAIVLPLFLVFGHDVRSSGCCRDETRRRACSANSGRRPAVCQLEQTRGSAPFLHQPRTSIWQLSRPTDPIIIISY